MTGGGKLVSIPGTPCKHHSKHNVAAGQINLVHFDSDYVVAGDEWIARNIKWAFHHRIAND
jgi:hypothetical protein